MVVGMSIAHVIAVPPTVTPGPAPITSNRWDPSTVEFTVVVPFHKPGARLREAVRRISATLFAQGISFEIIAVAFGSTDGSEGTLDDMPRTTVVVDRDVLDRGAALQLAGPGWPLLLTLQPLLIGLAGVALAWWLLSGRRLRRHERSLTPATAAR